MIFFIIKSNFTDFANFLCLQMYFGGAYTVWLRGRIPWEGGWDTGVGRSSSIHLNIVILNENPRAGKAA